MAETPAAAPANTKDTLLEKLENIKALIEKTFDEKEPRGNDTASLAVHAAMAGAMADVITDCKITQNCAIDQTFVEEWALTQLLMKDKLDHFIRLHLLSTNSPSAYLNKLESRPYQVADIDATITDQPLVPSAVQNGPMRIKMQHNEACAQLKDTLGRLAFFLRNEIPAIKAHVQSVEAKKQTINSTVPEEYRQLAMQVEDEKLDGYTTQLQTIETSCLYLLGKEDEAKQKLTKRPTLAGDNGFNTVPTIDDVIPVDRNGIEVPLNDQQKANEYEQYLDELREKFESQEQKPPPAATGSKRGKKINFPIGSKVEVQWPSDKKWYSATITHHVGGAKPYQVKYDVDGKLEDNVAAKRIRNPGGTSPAPSPAAAPPRAPSKPRARTKKRPREEETA